MPGTTRVKIHLPLEKIYNSHDYLMYLDCFTVLTVSVCMYSTYIPRPLRGSDYFTVSTLDAYILIQAVKGVSAFNIAIVAIWCLILIWPAEGILAFNVTLVILAMSLWTWPFLGHALNKHMSGLRNRWANCLKTKQNDLWIEWETSDVGLM